jgi:hypothetical protein
MQRIKPKVHTHTDFVVEIFSRIRRIVSYLKLTQLHKIHGLQLVITSHGFTPATEILEAEGFYSDTALIILADLLVGGVA